MRDGESDGMETVEHWVDRLPPPRADGSLRTPGNALLGARETSVRRVLSDPPVDGLSDEVRMSGVA